jgi:HD-like signal output (HDOD) protein
MPRGTTRLDRIRPLEQISQAKIIKQSPQPIAAFAARLPEIAVMPQVVFRIIELSGSEESSARQLEETIQIDPGFSARVLKLANSAQFALPRRISSIREASVLVGLRAVRQMAMQAGVFDLFVGKNDRESLRRRNWWRMSLEGSAACRKLAQRAGWDPDAASTAGLLHMIGRTALDRLDPKASELAHLAEDEGVPAAAGLRALFGLHHGEAAEAAAAAWGFPEDLSAALNWLEPSEEGPLARQRAVIHLGHVSARRSRTKNSALPAPWCLNALSIDPVQAEDWISEAEAAALGAQWGALG